WFLLFFKMRFRATRDDKWMQAYGFWVKVFALSFALGVVSGVTMSFQFGTNWPGYMNTVGNIAGPLLAYEVLSAFFLEATFLGVMLFGRQRVSDNMHTLATFLVAAGTTLSAFWILALNSWMQTPVGFEMIDGQAHVLSWWTVIFNPSLSYRLTHMLLASGLTASFLIAGVSAYQWLRGDRAPAVMAALRSGVFIAASLIPVQILVGDLHGLNTLEYQPAKIAAMEGLWHTERGAPLVLVAMPNQAGQRNDYAIAIPKLASVILTHSADGEVKGLDEYVGEQPPVAPVFWAFRIMVGVGVLMLVSSWLAAWTLRGGREPGAWVARALVTMTFAGWLATLAGWYVTEIGRQPYLVQGLLLTRDAASSTPASLIGLSLGMYLALYLLLIVSYVTVVFHLARKRARIDDPAAHGPATVAGSGLGASHSGLGKELPK
ncbi:MAG: cytochrome ubiquinol oxidase subunit I, partial [Arenimonas sp.]